MARQAVSAGVLASALLAVAFAARADDRVVVADFSSGVTMGGVPMGWELSEKSGKADLAVVKDGGLSALRFRSVKTSFSLQKEVKVDLEQFPMLAWKWKVTKLPMGGLFGTLSSDDQAAQLLVAFSKSQVISYVWSSTIPQGIVQSMYPVPFVTVKVVMLRSGTVDTMKWMNERRNVYQDYKEFFGSEPPPVSGVRLQINSQHTGTSAESYFAGVAFETAGPAKRSVAKAR